MTIIKRLIFLILMPSMLLNFIQNIYWIFLKSNFPFYFSCMLVGIFTGVIMFAFTFLKLGLWDK